MLGAAFSENAFKGKLPSKKSLQRRNHTMNFANEILETPSAPLFLDVADTPRVDSTIVRYFKETHVSSYI